MALNGKSIIVSVEAMQKYFGAVVKGRERAVLMARGEGGGGCWFAWDARGEIALHHSINHAAAASTPTNADRSPACTATTVAAAAAAADRYMDLPSLL